MEKRKLTKEDLDKVRNIEGFPIGKDEDIIALSDAPYYTACPNPFIKEFIKENGTPYDEETDDYHCEPFTADISEGKNDPFYMAHSYHTKVPYKAIMKYILHYTKPGDVVLDGFCGTGMTGVAAKMCSGPDETYKNEIKREMPEIKWGERKAILSDISPIATSISSGYNKHIDMGEFQQHANKILKEAHKKYDWLFETETDIISLVKTKAHVNYFVWSDYALCPHCGEEFLLYDMMWNPTTKQMSEEFQCPRCKSIIRKSDCDHAVETDIDELTGKVRQHKKSAPIIANYSIGKKRYEKRLDKSDYELLTKIKNMKYMGIAPSNPMMNKGENWGETWRSGYHFGITNVHHFYHKRTLIILEYLYSQCKENTRLIFWFTSCLPKLNIMNTW